MSDDVLRICYGGCAGFIGGNQPWPHVHIGRRLMEIIEAESRDSKTIGIHGFWDAVAPKLDDPSSAGQG